MTHALNTERSNSLKNKLSDNMDSRCSQEFTKNKHVRTLLIISNNTNIKMLYWSFTWWDCVLVVVKFQPWVIPSVSAEPAKHNQTSSSESVTIPPFNFELNDNLTLESLYAGLLKMNIYEVNIFIFLCICSLQKPSKMQWSKCVHANKKNANTVS